MNQRIILSSGRIVRTYESENGFTVFHQSHGVYYSFSGVYSLNDPRFSKPLDKT